MALAIYETHATANQAMDQLLAADFDSDAISLAMTHEVRERYYGSEASSSAWGAGVGAVVAELAAFSTVSPPALCVSGPLTAAFNDGASKDTEPAAVSTVLEKVGMPEDKARQFASQLERQAVLVAVRAPSAHRAHRAEKILLNAEGPIAPGNVHLISGASDISG